MDSRYNAFFKEGEKKLELAKEELLKPSEDLVGCAVCSNSQYAIENFLKGFLLKNGIEFDVNETLGVLYDKCKVVDENFKNIDLDAIKCSDLPIDSRCCTDIGTVSACFDTADDIDTYLRKSKLI